MNNYRLWICQPSVNIRWHGSRRAKILNVNWTHLFAKYSMYFCCINMRPSSNTSVQAFRTFTERTESLTWTQTREDKNVTITAHTVLSFWIVYGCIEVRIFRTLRFVYHMSSSSYLWLTAGHYTTTHSQSWPTIFSHQHLLLRSSQITSDL